MRHGYQKYKAKRTEFDGLSFPSRLEANVYAHHKMLEKTGEISDVKRYDTVTFNLACRCGIVITTGMRYKPDFSFMRNGEKIYVEAKGIETADWLKNKKLWKVGFGPGVLEIWKGKGSKVYLAETIIPKVCHG